MPWMPDGPPLVPEPDAPGPTALPSVGARALAFAAIVVAGVCGALIGYAIVDLSCHGDCTLPDGLGAVAGGAIAAGGVAVVTVLVLRALGEWRTIQEGERGPDS